MKQQLRLKFRRHKEKTGPKTKPLLICSDIRKACLPVGSRGEVGAQLGVLGPACMAVVHMLASEQRAVWPHG